MLVAAETRIVCNAAALCEIMLNLYGGLKDTIRYEPVLVVVRHEMAHCGGSVWRTAIAATADTKKATEKSCIVKAEGIEGLKAGTVRLGDW